jgi:hypothetical protein
LGDASFVPEPGSKTRVSLSEYVRLRFGATTFEQGEEEADLLDLAPALSNSSALSRGNE